MKVLRVGEKMEGGADGRTDGRREPNLSFDASASPLAAVPLPPSCLAAPALVFLLGGSRIEEGSLESLQRGFRTAACLPGSLLPAQPHHLLLGYHLLIGCCG